MADIEVLGTTETVDGYLFDIVVSAAGRRTTHAVTLSHADYERWRDDGLSPAAVARRSIELLLGRAGPSHLMDRFDVRQAMQLYPAFEAEAHRALE